MEKTTKNNNIVLQV